MNHGQLEVFGMNSYHNTTGERREKVLMERERKCRRENGAILDYFKAHSMESFTPYQIWNIFGRKQQITSVRRAITDLTKDGWLMTTGEMRPGGFGVNVNCWQYAGKTSNKK